MIKRLYAALMVLFIAVTITPDVSAHKTKTATDCTPDSSPNGVYHTGVCDSHITLLGTNIYTVRPHSHEFKTDINEWVTNYVETKQFLWGSLTGSCNLDIEGTPIYSTVTCFEMIFDGAFSNFITEIVQTLGFGIQFAAMLAIIFFGIKIVTGGIRVRPEMGMLILKLVLIAGIAGNVQLLQEWRFYLRSFSVETSSMVSDMVLNGEGTGIFVEDGAADVLPKEADVLLEGKLYSMRKVRLNSPATGVTADDSAFDVDCIPDPVIIDQYKVNGMTCANLSGSAKFNCELAYLDNRKAAINDNVFARMDCIITSALGKVKGTDDSFMGMAAVMVGTIFMGGLGGMISLAAIGGIVMLLMSVVVAVAIYLKAMIAVSFLIALTPIILPMWFFNVFRKVVSTWAKFILMYSLQPIVLFAYLSMFLMVVGIASGGLRLLYENADETANSVSSRKYTRLFNLDSTQISAEEMSVFMEELKKRAAMGVGAPVAGDVGYLQYRAAGGSPSADNKEAMTGMATITNLSPDEISEYLDMKINANILDWSDQTRKQYIAQQLVFFIILYCMFSFLLYLPSIVDKMVAAGMNVPTLLNTGKGRDAWMDTSKGFGTIHGAADAARGKIHG